MEYLLSVAEMPDVTVQEGTGDRTTLAVSADAWRAGMITGG